MKRMNRWLVTAGTAGMLVFAAGQAMAQGGGGGGGPGAGGAGMGGNGGLGRMNFNDPAQLAQMLTDNFRSVLEVTNDQDWAVLRIRVQNVLQGRIDVTMSSMGGMMNMFGGRRGGTGAGGFGGGRGGFGGRLGTVSPEEDALQKAIDSNASSGVLKTALSRVAAARQAKQAKLEKAQDDLRSLLTVRQEAIATASGLL